MRVRLIAGLMLISALLSGCVTSLVVGDMPNRLLWATLKPLVGFDPNDINLWDMPIVKDRMQDFLGDYYQPTLMALTTATELKQQGALFYVLSNYTPAAEYAQQVGLVWNADTDNFAVLLKDNAKTLLINEVLPTAQEYIAPVFPDELMPLAAGAYDVYEAVGQLEQAPERLTKQAVEAGLELMLQSSGDLPPADYAPALSVGD